MSISDEDKALLDLDKALAMLGPSSKAGVAEQLRKARDDEWKRNDPEGYKADMEQMCKAMFGDDWRPAFEAMMREEFPEEYAQDEP